MLVIFVYKPTTEALWISNYDYDKIVEMAERGFNEIYFEALITEL